MDTLWYEKPAGEWEEALPIGNGRLGAMIYGGVSSEIVQVNEESMWYGGKRKRQNPDAFANLSAVREHLKNQRPREAEKLMDAALSGCPDAMHPYQTLGEIQFVFDHVGRPPRRVSGLVLQADLPEGITDYRRSLSLDESVCRVSFRDGDTLFEREIIASKPADCILFHFTAKGSKRISFHARLRRGTAFDGVEKSGDRGILLHGNLGRGGAEFAMELCVDIGKMEPPMESLRDGAAPGENGRIAVVGESLIVEDAEEVFLYFTADTTHHYTSREKDVYVRRKLPVLLGGGCPADAVWENYYGSEARPDFSGENRAQDMRFHAVENIAHANLPGDETGDFDCLESLYQNALQMFLKEKLEARLSKVMKCSWETLMAEHQADYQALYHRFSLSLTEKNGDAGGSADKPTDKLTDKPAGKLTGKPTGKPTDKRTGKLTDKPADKPAGKPADQRLEAVKNGREDIALEQLLFDYGRYLMISCSREGTLPATLQGIWNKDLSPAWDSKYTININTQMNYWFVESCGLSECHMPLFDLIRKMQKDGRRTAREMYHCRGFVAHHNTDIYGDTAPQDVWYPGTYWVMGAAWLCTHLWMHYQYTCDREFLESAFPVMAEAALFFVDFLMEENGYLATNPSVSPENSYYLPNGEIASVCIGATMDNQILRHLFDGCLEAWEVLGYAAPAECEIPDVESIPELMEAIAHCRARLRPEQTAKDGTLLEWMEEYEEPEPGHRHISHLYGLYPGEQITPDGTPELAKAARKTLEKRLQNGGGHTGWSRAWIINHYAYLWDGEAAHENLRKLLTLSTYPNLFDRHPPFQIDGNFGVCAGVCGMLAQSSHGRTVLLPALPQAWKNGKVCGLCLKGNAVLDMEWEDGILSKAAVSARSDYHTDFVYLGQRIAVDMKAGERRELDFR